MNTKALLGFCVTLAFLSMPIVFLLNPLLQTIPFTSYETEFIGQEVAEVGELCKFMAEGEKIEWECLPYTDDSESFGKNNENYVVSFRKPGTYTIIAAIYSNGELTIHTQPVIVEGIVEKIIVDPPNPPILNAQLISKVEGWVKKYQVNSEMCKILASNFNQVAARKDLETPSQIIAATAKLNMNLELNEDLMAELQAYLTAQSDLGNLRTPEQHRIVWQSIAKGLMNGSS